ncbi:MAG: GNAT family N-acetyltransferase [Fibrobacterales bacterium]
MVKVLNQLSKIEFEDYLDTLSTAIYKDDPCFVKSPVSITSAQHKYFVVIQNEVVVACAIAFIDKKLQYNGVETGGIGYFESLDDIQCVKYLFTHIEQYFKAHRVTECIGPINGSTWNKHRLNAPDSEPTFFLDNYHAPWYLNLWKESGYRSISEYESTSVKRNNFSFTRLSRFSNYYSKKNITFRPLSIDEFERDIGSIYSLCIKSFADNFLFTPIADTDFQKMYYQAKTFIDPQWVILAENGEGELLAVIFAVKDVYCTTSKRLIIKSLAIDPEKSPRGLGAYLVELLHQQAHNTGYDEIIHALMHKNNISTNIVSKSSSSFRTYHLMGKEL